MVVQIGNNQGASMFVHKNVMYVHRVTRRGGEEKFETVCTLSALISSTAVGVRWMVKMGMSSLECVPL